MTAEPLCRRWHLSRRNSGRSGPDAIIAEALCRRWHLPLRNPAARPAVLQHVGQAVLAGLAADKGGLAGQARRCVAELRGRDWSGDDILRVPG
jgi:hypothetical protein